jgi:hypothetical protein
MRLRIYEQLYSVNWHLVEATRELEALAKTLKLDRAAVQLMLHQIDEVRRDANCSLANQINDRELAAARKHPTKNWRLENLRQTSHS